MHSLLTVAEPGSRVETSGQSAEGTRDSPAGSGEVGGQQCMGVPSLLWTKGSQQEAFHVGGEVGTEVGNEE